MRGFNNINDKKITAVKAMEILGLKPNTFYKFVAEEQGKI
jgi:predicted DNA-binding transcriptional regulator AlpA